MMHRMSYKNEKILAFSIDLLVITILMSITYVLFEYPHIFPYFKEIEAAKEIIDPQKYMLTMDALNQRFDYVVFEVASVYFLYETLCLILFRQTIGRKLFHRKVYLDFQSKYDIFLRIAIIPVRTFVKIIFVVWMVPVIILGALFMFGKIDKTLLDTIFLTETRVESE